MNFEKGRIRMTTEYLYLLEFAARAVELTQGNALIFTLGIGAQIYPNGISNGIQMSSYR
jgi:hypothetical protein